MESIVTDPCDAITAAKEQAQCTHEIEHERDVVLRCWQMWHDSSSLELLVADKFIREKTQQDLHATIRDWILKIHKEEAQP